MLYQKAEDFTVKDAQLKLILEETQSETVVADLVC